MRNSKFEVAVKWLYWLLLLCLPWTTEWSLGEQSNISLPTEPILGLLALMIGYKVVADFIKKIPPRLNEKAEEGRGGYKTTRVSYVLSACFLLWMSVCAYFSSMPLVSFKYLIVELVQWVVFFLGAILYPEAIVFALSAFLWSLCGLVCYTLLHFSFFHFRADQALLAPMPFFPEHNMYAAVLAAGFWLNRRPDIKALLLFIGIVCAGSRAGLASFLISLFVFLLYSMAYNKQCLPERYGKIVSGINLKRLIKWSSFFVFAILLALWRNGEWTKAALWEDISFKERLNRYACAYEMFRDRPALGFGPGTYQFQYIPYQKTSQMTRISTTDPFQPRSIHTYGKGGGAHSEYLQALSEMGFLGAVILLGFFAWALIHPWTNPTKLYWRLAILTLFLHYFLNNFSHDSRIAFLFWSSLAFLQRPENFEKK